MQWHSLTWLVLQQQTLSQANTEVPRLQVQLLAQTAQQKLCQRQQRPSCLTTAAQTMQRSSSTAAGALLRLPLQRRRLRAPLQQTPRPLAPQWRCAAAAAVAGHGAWHPGSWHR